MTRARHRPWWMTAAMAVLVSGLVAVALWTTPAPGSGAVLASAVGSSASWTGPPVAAATMPLVAPAGTVLHTRTVLVDGLVRTSVLVTPALLPAGPLPLVVVLHGRGQSPGAAVTVTGFGPLAGTGRALLLYPEGVGASWNAGHGCCGPAALHRPDDAAFVDAAVADVRAHAHVDPRRIALVGYSNGGKLAYALTCDPARPFAAVATYGAVPLARCAGPRPPRPLSYLLAVGSADTVMPLGGRLSGTVPQPSVAVGVGWLRERDRCTAAPVRGSTARPVSTTWSCADGTRVVLDVYPGHAHGWPTAPDTAPMSEVISAFLDLSPT